MRMTLTHGAPTTVALLVAGTLAVAASPALADRMPGTTLFAGAEVDDQDSQRLDLALSTLSDGGTGLDLAAAWTDTDWSNGDLSSTHVFGLVTHDFGKFGLGGGARYIRDEDYAETLGLIGAAFWDFDGVRVTLRLEGRNTDFDQTSFTASGEELGLVDVVSVSGTSRCSVDSLGYGLALDASFDNWSFYASAMAYDYDSHDCRIEITSVVDGGTNGGAGNGGSPGPGWQGGVKGPAARQLVTFTAAPLAGYTSTLLPRDSALLESSVMAGARFGIGSRSSLGAELYYESEEFAPVDATTLLGFFNHDVGSKATLELTVGATDADGYDTAAFIGLGVYVDVGG
jgi:hypothetical protein